MIPRQFDYYDPTDLSGTVRLLERYGSDAKLMAGGQSLLPMMKTRLVSPKVIVDLWRVPELAYIREENGVIAIGPMTTHYMLHSSKLIQTKLPVLAEAAQVVGDPLVRNLGTIGGSAAHAAPNADYPAVLVALGAEMRIVGPKATRNIAAEGFFKDFFTSALEPSEVLSEIRIPIPPGHSAGAYLKLSRRGTDFALVGVAAVLEREDGERCVAARLVLGGVGPVPVEAKEAEELLKGKSLTSALIQEAGEAATKALDPISDVQADAPYRIDVSKVYVRRALQAAWGRTA
jgi:aerobic carbon-monoxide dehydrogenase medium subunit